jgi:hypothetical protein
VHCADRDAHFNKQDHTEKSREQAKHVEQSARDFERSRNKAKPAWISHANEHLHCGGGVREFRPAMRKEERSGSNS